MYMLKLKTAGSRNYCTNAFMVYHGSDTSLMSEGIEICVLKKDGVLVMKCKEEELTAADKRHLKIFRKRLGHRMS